MTLSDRRSPQAFGDVVALDGLAFDVPGGQVFGFLGANGAGKTTTMRIVLGVLEADSRHGRPGTAPTAGPCRGRRGATCPRSAASTRGCVVLDQLDLLRRALRHPAATAPGARRTHWLARFRVPDLAERRADELSKGNQQKIQLIAAVLHDPQVLLMDEPFTGLDPVNVAILREAFLELRDAGQDADLLDPPDGDGRGDVRVDRDRRPRAGRRRRARCARSAARRGGGCVHLSVEGDHRLPWLAGVAGGADPAAGVDRTEIELDEGVEPDAVLAAAIANGASGDATSRSTRSSLEQIFIDHVGRPADDDEHFAPGDVPPLDGDEVAAPAAVRRSAVAGDEPVA